MILLTLGELRVYTIPSFAGVYFLYDMIPIWEQSMIGL